MKSAVTVSRNAGFSQRAWVVLTDRIHDGWITMLVEAIWFLLVGTLLTFVALARGPIQRLPLTGAMIYMMVGIVAGPGCAGLVKVDLANEPHVLRLVTEVGLVVSLFAIGMHLRLALGHPLWRWILRLGAPAMLITIASVTLFAYYILHMPLGVSVFLAAAVAPTDPVLANELRVQEAGDDEPVRVALSGEGGLNDGAALPFVALAFALLQPDSIDVHTFTSFAAQTIWGIASAIVLSIVFAKIFANVVFRLRTRFQEAIGLDGFLALGLTCATYGAALMIHAYAFIAVFAAGVALRREELRATGDTPPAEVLEGVARSERGDVAADPELAHAYLAEAMMEFTIEIEHFAECLLMLLIGCVASAHWRELLSISAWLPAVFLFVVARPLSVAISMAGSDAQWSQRCMIAWLGIRGVGAFYYVMFGIEDSGAQIRPLLPAVLDTIILSVIFHGATAGYALKRYLARQRVA